MTLPTPSDTFREFQNLVVRDPRLFAQLTGAPDTDVFAARVVAVAAERGFTLTVDEVRAAVQAARRGWIERGIA